jgi:formyl-CoA transferase
LFCAYGIVVALLEREDSGRGQWLHTSLLEAQAFMLDFQAARWLMGNQVVSQDGNYHSTIAPCGTFAAADGDLSLADVGQLMWTRFCHALGREEWTHMPDYASNEQRMLNRARLQTEIERLLGTKPRARWVEHLNDASVPCGPVYAIDEMFNDPQLAQLGLVQDFSGPDSRSRKYLGQPLTMTRTPSKVTRHAPALGEHTDTVLEELGFNSAKIADLHARGVV